MTLPVNTRQLMTAITDRTISFLKEEAAVDATDSRFKFQDMQRLRLRDLSSLISIGGKLNIYVVFSFEESLITKIFENYTEELELDPDEKVEYMEETAGEMINIIIGNTMMSFQEKGSAIHFSPPIIIPEARHIVRHKNAKFVTSDVDTPHGSMGIFLVGPRELFDDKLEYI